MYRRALYIGVATLACGLALAGPASAAKGKISLVIDGHNDAPIDISSYSLGVANSGTAHTGGGAGAGKASFQDLHLTKNVDASSTELFRDVATGRHHAKAALQFVAGPFVTAYCLKEVLVTSLAHSATAGDELPREQVSLNFASITFAVGTTKFTYDIAGNAEDPVGDLCA